MRTLRSRFILSHILPLLLVTPLMGLALIYILETQVLLSDLSQRLTERAQQIAATLNQQPDIWTDPQAAQAFVVGVSIQFSGGSLTLLTPRGDLLATNDPAVIQGSELPLAPGDVETAAGGQQSIEIYYGWLESQAVVLLPVTGGNEQLLGIVAVSQTVKTAADQFARLRRLVVAALLLQLLLSSLIGLVLAWRLEKPIGRAAGAVIDIAAGQAVAPVPETGPAELRRLATAVNTLAERLRLLEETRRRLLANVVHELGRPLGAIQAAIHVLRQGAGDDPEIREELLAGVEAEITRLHPLLDDLAQLHGQVLGTLALAPRPVAISDWLPPLLLPWRAAALEKGLQWQAEIPPNLPTLALDPDRMAQVVGNLLSNGIKYTPAGGQLIVTAGVQGQELWLRVQDTGPGIDPAEQAAVFDPFYRSQKLRRFPQGLGLGLTITRDLVQAHGGRLTLASEPGRGSTFTVWLPIMRPLPAG